MDFAEIVQARLDELGHNINSFESSLGWPQGFLRAVVRTDKKRTIPNIERAEAICEALGLEFYIGPRRGGPSAAGFAEAARDFIKPSLDGSPEALEQGYLPIPFHRADLAHRDLSHVAFARAWIEDQGLDAEHLHAVVMPNDDMWPALNPGDLLLIDGSFAPEPEPTLCAFSVGAHLKVGWLTVPKGGCLVGFFQRSFTPPVVRAGKSGARIECLGRIAARLDGFPGPWIDESEKRRLVDMARDLVNGRTKG